MKKVYIVSILKRKDYEKMLKLLLKDKNATFIFTSGNNAERYTSGDELYKVAMKYKCNEQEVFVKSLEDAIKFVMNEKNNTVNFVVGSFYVYGTVINFMKQNSTKNETN